MEHINIIDITDKIDMYKLTMSFLIAALTKEEDYSLNEKFGANYAFEFLEKDMEKFTDELLQLKNK